MMSNNKELLSIISFLVSHSRLSLCYNGDMDIKSRLFQNEDIDSLIPILLKTWDYDYLFSLDKRQKATRLFLYRCLIHSNYRRVITVSNQVKGIILANTIFDYQDEYYSSLYQNLSIEYRDDSELNELLQYNDIVFLSNETLMKEVNYDHDEIILLILDKDSQGKGFGKTLLEEFYSKREGVLPILLSTDDDCDYPFYENCGYSIISECTLPYEFNGKKEILHSYLFYLK